MRVASGASADKMRSARVLRADHADYANRRAQN
jgi:hypothetical protein